MVKRILVIDDQESMRSIISQMLKDKGHQVLAAADGEEGLKLFDQKPEMIDLVLADVNMPKKDGFEVLKAIKSNRPQTPVILMTGTNQDMAQYFGKEFKADGVINKPFVVAEVIKTIEKLLGQ
ncbi:response regulator transcription factor [Candidatus Margulisiibacteriota bacterium]